MALRIWKEGLRALSVSAVVLAWSAATTAAPLYRSIDGTGNNVAHPEWGAAGTPLLRTEIPMSVPAAYPDGGSMPTGLPSAREVSNGVAAQSGSIPNTVGATDFLWQWGQFVDHDIDLTHTGGEDASIPVPAGDPYFTSPIAFTRSVYDTATGTDSSNPRQQVNEITSFLDGSTIYGSDATTAAELRTFSGGKLKTLSTPVGDLLPLVSGSSTYTPGDMFVSGDERVNEQVGLTSMHTLFMREHNRLAEQIAAASPQLAGETDADFDERVYQQARKVVGAEIESITYNEFLPMILGPGALPDYSGYDPSVDPGISNVFSTAAYRFGHSMLSPTLLRLDENGNVISAGNLPLRDAFFDPSQIIDNGGIEPILRGLATQTAQDVDPYVIDDVRNFLFGPPGAGGLDLAALNIQRGRDHGIPGYNELRGLVLGPGAIYSGWDDPNLDFLPGAKDALEAVYTNFDDIDAWIGGLAEAHVNGGLMGELFSAILIDQFERLRAGDRFFYLNDGLFEDTWLDLIRNSTLSAVIMRNTTISGMRASVFFVPEPAAFTLFAVGLIGLCRVRRRRTMPA